MSIPDSSLTLTDYAKRRGVSKMSVSRAVSSGRLSRCVVRDATGKPRITDAALADQEWEANTDPTPRGTNSLNYDNPDFNESKARKEHWLAEHAELKFKEAAGELVPAADVTSKLADVFQTCKSKLMGLPSRARQQLPHLSVADVTVIEALVREALEDLSGGDL